ncbi:hypothetical protein TNCV_4555691 [Trichonephila clavipes]|nr:hypothetical protein TNCV_4555691 [Trichonephila clavipes]
MCLELGRYTGRSGDSPAVNWNGQTVGGDKLEGERLLEEHEGAKHAIELQLEISDASMEYKLVSKRLSTLPERRRGVTSLKESFNIKNTSNN